MNSAIYEGNVWHRRYKPRHHQFNYKVFMVWLDLDEAQDVFAKTRLWSADSRAAVQFRRQDFFGEYEKPLKQAVQDWVYDKTGQRLKGPVRMLANLRVFGFLINPIVCYYCYSEDESTLEYVVTEVTNTPWNERTHYLLSCQGMDQDQKKTATGEFEKNLHVSPFHPMDMRYQWQLNKPEQIMHLSFDNLHRGEVVFDAGFRFQRVPLSASSMRAVLWRYPFMTVKVAAAIYWQAVKLFIKRVPLFAHPKNQRNAVAEEL